MLIMKEKKKNVNYDLMDKDPNNWRGIFYFNKKDARIIVPKINPLMGWTVNFANPYAYLIIFGIISFIIASNYLL